METVSQAFQRQSKLCALRFASAILRVTLSKSIALTLISGVERLIYGHLAYI